MDAALTAPHSVREPKEHADADAFDVLSPGRLIGGFAIVAILAMAFVIYISQASASAAGILVAVFPPTIEQDETFSAIVAADGAFVRAGTPANIVLAASETPGFAGRLKDEGALLVYAGPRFGYELAACFIPAGHGTSLLLR